MKNLWRILLERLDRLKFRERVLLFAATVIILATATEIFFIAPVSVQQKKLTNQLNSEVADSEARTDRVQSSRIVGERLRITALETSIKQADAELAAIKVEIAKLSLPTGDAAGLSTLLSKLLIRNERVKMVRIVSAGSDAVVAPPTIGALLAAAGGQAPPPLPAAATVATSATALLAPRVGEPAPVKRSSLDVTFAGSYLDLMENLASLEKAMPTLRWGALKFSTETVPAQLSVRITFIGSGD